MAVAVVMSLVVINGTIGAVATAKLLTGQGGGWPSVHQRAAFTLEMLLVLGLLVLIGLGTVVPRIFLPGVVGSRVGRFIAWACVWNGLVSLPIVTVFILVSFVHPPSEVPLG